MNKFTIKHFHNWLALNIDDSEREAVGLMMWDFVAKYPEVLEHNNSWPEIKELAEHQML